MKAKTRVIFFRIYRMNEESIEDRMEWKEGME
jgi:hypothetical protein